MRTRGIGTAAAGMVMMLFTLHASAMGPCPAGRGRGGPGGMMMEQHLKQLNLTPEQWSQLDAQREEHRRMMKTLRKSLRIMRRELRDELDKGKSDSAKIDAIGAELKRLESLRIDTEIKGILQMKAVLTPEQFTKLISLREEHRGGRGGRRGGGPPCPPGEGAEEEESLPPGEKPAAE